MNKKKKGMTLLEVIITLFIMGLVISLIYPIFISNNKKIIETDMKQTLQMEASEIEKRITETLVQSNGIKEILQVSTDAENKNDSNSLMNSESIKFDSYDSKVENYIPCELKLSKNKEKDGKSIYTLKLIKDGNEIYLSENVEKFSINIINGDNFINASSVNIKISLYYKKGITIVEQPIEMNITFRNK